MLNHLKKYLNGLGGGRGVGSFDFYIVMIQSHERNIKQLSVT
jgi:hypothetical protein